MNSSKLYSALAGLALSGLSGCFITPEPGPGPGPGPGPTPSTGTGTVTVTWTVTGSHSAPACAQFGADALELVILDRFRRPIASVTAPCADFTVTVPLPSGNYEAEATLLDTSSRAASTMLTLRDIRIVPGSDLTIDVDFPGSSQL